MGHVAETEGGTSEMQMVSNRTLKMVHSVHAFPSGNKDMGGCKTRAV